MKLKQEDRNLLYQFFDANADWIKTTNFFNFENLINLQKRFLEFMKSNSCEENIACQLFLITLNQELQNCEKRDLIKQYEENKKTNKSKRIKLNSIPVVKPKCNNLKILEWIEETSMHEVSKFEITKLNNSIKEKAKQNQNVLMQSSLELKHKFIK